MKWRARWSHVAIALGVIAALAIAAPVFGVDKAIDKSLKKAIKKEVSKQVAKAVGPAGSPGATGAAGAPGSARAFGKVSDVGVLSRSQNVVMVTTPLAGTYCIVLPASINANSAVLIVGPDAAENEVNTTGADESYVEWDSAGTGCPPNSMKVLTYLYDGDITDDDDGGGNTAGDILTLDGESFSFMVP